LLNFPLHPKQSESFFLADIAYKKYRSCSQVGFQVLWSAERGTDYTRLEFSKPSPLEQKVVFVACIRSHSGPDLMTFKCHFLNVTSSQIID